MISPSATTLPDRRRMRGAVAAYVAAVGLGIALALPVSRYCLPVGGVLAALIAVWLRMQARAIPTDEPDARGAWLAVSQLGIAWGIGFTLTAIFLVVDWSADQGVGKVLREAFDTFLLVATSIGGLYAVFRSTSTQAHAQATKAGLDRIHDRLHTPLADLAVEAHFATRRQDIAARLIDMLVLAVRLPDTSKHVDAISLWARRGSDWVVVLGYPPDDRRTGYRQAVLDVETPGGGIVANMAVTGTDAFMASAAAERHPWWMRYDGGRCNAGIAGVLLRDSSGEPIGCVCLTSERPGEISDTPVMRSLLHYWGLSFTLAFEALLRSEV